MILRNVQLLNDDSLSDIEWDSNGKYTITQANSSSTSLDPQRDDLSSPSTQMSHDEIDAKGSVLIPGGLVHPHVHLDKCYLLDKTPIGDGTFQEALKETGKAKASFQLQDVISRGRRLITTSISHGVTQMRAHVEVDPTVSHLCLEAGLKLVEEFKKSIKINLVVFAQDPIFYPSDQDKESRMKQLLREALAKNRETIRCLGSTPYVEEDLEHSKKNIDFAFELAREFEVDLDFHLDYDLDRKKESLLWYVIQKAKTLPKWQVKDPTSNSSRPYRITIGHCTKLCLFNPQEFDSLRNECKDLDISFVSLPNSDLYMQARNLDYSEKIRSTLPGLELVKRGVKVSLGVNNVGNLFTPHGDADPLALLPLMVSIWQGAKEEDMKHLLEMVTSSASFSAGGEEKPDYSSATLIDGCKDLQSVVLAPTFGRTTIYKGKVVSRRVVNTEMSLEK